MTRAQVDGNSELVMHYMMEFYFESAAMETLTVIAYNQPVSRAFIEQVRGVDSSSSVSGLLEKGH